jgi:uncharacterized protein
MPSVRSAELALCGTKMQEESPASPPTVLERGSPPPPLPASPGATAEPQLQIASGPLMAHACRFPTSLRCMAAQTGAHCILSIVGSLSSLTLRMPQHRTDPRLPLFLLQDVPLEIVSATGTFARDDDKNNDDGRINFHIHLSVSDSSGQVYGGHLIDGTVRTTAEVVLGSLQHVHFGRAMDPATGFDELVVVDEEMKEK